MAIVNSICNITAFNHNQTEIFNCNDANDDSMVVLVDHSGSIEGANEALLRSAVASLTNGTNAHRKFKIPKPSGFTSIVETVKKAIEKHPEKVLVLCTDGFDNMNSLPLDMGQKDGVSHMVEWKGTDEDKSKLLADWLEIQGVKICLLGIGEAAKPMMKQMLNKRNVFVGYVDNTLSTKQIFSVVSTLRKISKKNGHANTSTRNGVQNVVLTSDNADVNETLQGLSVSDILEIEESICHVQIEKGHLLCLSDVKQKIDDAFNQYNKKINLLDSEKDVKTGVLFAMRQMCNQETPGAVVSGKYSSVLGVPTNCPQFGTHCNRIFTIMLSLGVLKKGSDTPDEGVDISVDGIEWHFGKNCCQYSCPLPYEMIAQISEDETYCTKLDEFPKRKINVKKNSVKKTNKKQKDPKPTIHKK